MTTPKRRINPDHLPDTTYPFFWVQPLEAGDSDSAYSARVLDSWDNATLYGLYRYEKPDSSGMSVATWIADFEKLETADAIAGALNIARDLLDSTSCPPEELVAAKAIIYLF